MKEANVVLLYSTERTHEKLKRTSPCWTHLKHVFMQFMLLCWARHRATILLPMVDVVLLRRCYFREAKSRPRS